MWHPTLINRFKRFNSLMLRNANGYLRHNEALELLDLKDMLRRLGRNPHERVEIDYVAALRDYKWFIHRETPGEYLGYPPASNVA